MMVKSLLDDDEFVVYKAIKEYLKDNRFFKTQNIISYLKYNLDKSLGYTTLKIEKIIRSLLKKNLIAPRSKLVREDVLKNEKRKQIYKSIEANPGIYFYVIMKFVKLGTHQALWHLNILKKFLFIRSIHLDNHEIFFKFDLDPINDKLLYYLRNDKIRNIIELMENYYHGLHSTGISKNLNMHYQTTTKYLKILVDLNLLNIISENKKIMYKLNLQSYYGNLEILKKLKQKIED